MAEDALRFYGSGMPVHRINHLMMDRLVHCSACGKSSGFSIHGADTERIIREAVDVLCAEIIRQRPSNWHDWDKKRERHRNSVRRYRARAQNREVADESDTEYDPDWVDPSEIQTLGGRGPAYGQLVSMFG
jgi:hypothetical protein